MPHPALVVLTARPLDEILREKRSSDWRLDPGRAHRAEYLVCTQNQHNRAFRHPTAPHGAAFLIARIADVAPSRDRPDERWDIMLGEYTVPDPPIPDVWGKSGHLRYPVWYTTLEDLGIDLAALPPFRPIASRPPGLAEVQVPLAISQAAPEHGIARLDAILAQLDRIPDAPAPFQPLAWDEHGLPR